MIFKNKFKPLYNPKSSGKFLLAYNAFNRKPIYLTPAQLEAHWHILGGTRKGKSKYIEHLVQSFIQQKDGVCVIDPHGELYDELVRYITRNRLEDRTILIDPNEDEWVVGLNYLEKMDTTEKGIHDLVSNVLRAFMKVFGEIDEGAKPRFERWGRNLFHLLTETNCTLVESRDFLGIDNQAYRTRLLDQAHENYYIKEWQEFERYTLREKLNLLESVYNRLNKFIGHERIRRIVGQSKSTVNFRQAMDEGKIILINLNPRKFSHEIKNMLGVMIVDMIVEAATSRRNIPKEKRKPFYLVVDEFGEIVCDDFAYAMDACGKSRVWLILAHQHLDQLRLDYPKIFGSVMSNTDIKISFGISANNAEVMVQEMFAGQFREDVVKKEFWSTKFRPVIEWVNVESHSHSEGQSSGRGSGTSQSRGQSDFKTQSFQPDSGLFFSDSIGFTTGEGEMLSFGSMDSEFDSSSSTESHSTTTVPVTMHEEFKELSNIAYYTPDGLKQKFIGWLVNQGPQHAELKIGAKAPMAIVTPWMDEVRVREKDVETTKEKVFQVYARPVAEVDRQLAERQQALLDKPTVMPVDFRKTDIEEAKFQELKDKPKDKPDDIISEDDYRE